MKDPEEILVDEENYIIGKEEWDKLIKVLKDHKTHIKQLRERIQFIEDDLSY